MKEIKIKVYDFKILNETYLVYVIKEEEFTKFYIGKKGYGVIKHSISLNIDKVGINIEDFINENLIEWIYFYNLDMEEE